MEEKNSRFVPIEIRGRGRVSKVVPEISVTSTYIYFNKASIRMYFDDKPVVFTHILYDDIANEYLIIDLKGKLEMLTGVYYTIRNGRLSHTVVASEILENVGARPIVSFDKEGMILSRREDDNNS